MEFERLLIIPLPISIFPKLLPDKAKELSRDPDEHEAGAPQIAYLAIARKSQLDRMRT